MFEKIEKKMNEDFDLFKGDFKRINQADYYLMRYDMADYLVSDLSEENGKRIYISPNNVRINFPLNYPYRHVNKFSKYGEALAGWRSPKTEGRAKASISKRFGYAYSVHMSARNVAVGADLISFLGIPDIEDREEITKEHISGKSFVKDSRVNLDIDKDIFDYVDEKQKEISFHAKLPLVLNGFAGTGKTVVLQQLALREIESHSDKVIMLSSAQSVIDDARAFSSKNNVTRNFESFSFKDIRENLNAIDELGDARGIDFSNEGTVLKGLNNIFSLSDDLEENIEKVFEVQTSPIYKSYSTDKKLDFKEYKFVGIDEAPLMVKYDLLEHLEHNKFYCLAYDVNQHKEEDIEEIRKIFSTLSVSSINLVHRTTKEIFTFASSFIGIEPGSVEFAYSDEKSIQWKGAEEATPSNVYKISEIEEYIDELVGMEFDEVNVEFDVKPECDPHLLYILFTRAKLQLNLYGEYMEVVRNVYKKRTA